MQIPASVWTGGQELMDQLRRAGALSTSQREWQPLGSHLPESPREVHFGLWRSDNCVKNHFYSRLRKSLRTVNRIAKQFLKKQVKEISDVVIYKLTEATDEALKEKKEISEEVIAMTYGIFTLIQIWRIDSSSTMLMGGTTSRSPIESSRKICFWGLEILIKYTKKSLKRKKYLFWGLKTSRREEPTRTKERNNSYMKMKTIYVNLTQKLKDKKMIRKILRRYWTKWQTKCQKLWTKFQMNNVLINKIKINLVLLCQFTKEQKIFWLRLLPHHLRKKRTGILTSSFLVNFWRIKLISKDLSKKT